MSFFSCTILLFIIEARVILVLEKNRLKFTTLSSVKTGFLFFLLKKSYRDFIKKYKIPRIGQLLKNWQKFDQEAFSNPQIGKCVFISCLNNQSIGFASFDPRPKPTYGIIGHNCILPEYSAQGFGKKQVSEILRRFKKMGIKKARVSTGDHPFFIPAQRMYLHCGFKEIRRFKDEKIDYPVIEFEKELKG